MKAAYLPLRIEAGTTYRKTLIYCPGGVPADLTDFYVRFAVAATAGTTVEAASLFLDSRVPIEGQPDPDRVWIEPLTGEINIYLNPYTTSTLGPSLPQQYELELYKYGTDPTPYEYEVIRVARGPITACPELAVDTQVPVV